MITEGILNINKPQNMTSHDVVAIARRTLGIRKIGHTGTLDPMATGVLPVCIGKATKIIEYLDMDLKTYRCSFILGLKTDTLDIWGEELAREAVRVTEEQVLEAVSKFQGIIEQTPPMYSAIKVNGRKLYEYARDGQDVQVKPRKIYIKDISVLDMNLSVFNPQITFLCQCSKGTYIRTLCQDIGEALGTTGCMTSLERTESGIFNIDNSITVDELKELSLEEIEEKLYKTSEPLEAFGQVHVNEEIAEKFMQGWHLSLKDCEIEREPFYASHDFYIDIREDFRRAYNVFGRLEEGDKFLGVAVYSKKYKKLVADKVFYVRTQ